MRTRRIYTNTAENLLVFSRDCIWERHTRTAAKGREEKGSAGLGAAAVVEEVAAARC